MLNEQKHDYRKSAHLIISGVIPISLPSYPDIKILTHALQQFSSAVWAPLSSFLRLVAMVSIGQLWPTFIIVPTPREEGRQLLLLWSLNSNETEKNKYLISGDKIHEEKQKKIRNRKERGGVTLF